MKIASYKTHFLWISGSILLLLLLGSIPVPGFQHIGMYFSILTQASVMGIMALGMLFVVICGDIDLSIGAQVAWYGMICTHAAARMPLLLAVCVTLIAAVCYGLLIGYCTERFHSSAVVTTIAGGALLSGITNIIVKGIPVFEIPLFLEKLVSIKLWKFSFVSLMFLLLACISGVILHFMYIGKQFYAIGSSKTDAKDAGVNVQATRMIAFACCSLFCAVGAILMIGRIGVASINAGWDTVLKVLAILALGGARLSGGRGSVVRTVCAAFWISALSAVLLALRIASYYETLLYALILLLTMAELHKIS